MKSNINAGEMKEINKYSILSFISKGGYSRADLARVTGLTRAAITLIVDALISSGMVFEGEKMEVKKGRKSVLLKIREDAYYSVGINISRKGYSVGAADLGGKVLAEKRYGYNSQSTEEILQGISRSVDEILASLGKGGALGIGMTMPGPIGTSRGLEIVAPDFNRWANTDFVSYFTEKFALPVFAENNSKATALAEKTHGLGKELNSFLLLVVDYSGIGSGLILSGELFKGGLGLGSELGHTSIDLRGERCACGNYGCAELYASVSNILKYAFGLNPDLNSWQKVIDGALDGDEICRKVVDRETEYLTCLIVNAVNFTDVEDVVLFGDIHYKAHAFLDTLSARVNERLIARKFRRLKLHVSALNKDADILSAANLVTDAYFAGQLRTK